MDTETQNCLTCDASFTPRRAGNPQKYCSPKCRSAWHNRKKERAIWRSENPELLAFYARNHHLRKNFGITTADYDEMLASQNGVCAICGTTDTSPWQWFCVDHDHQTGEIRGLLCRGCNTCIGQALDDPRVLRDAADYLERSRGHEVVFEPAFELEWLLGADLEVVFEADL